MGVAGNGGGEHFFFAGVGEERGRRTRLLGRGQRVGILTGLAAQVRGKAQAYFIKGNSNATGCSANRVQHRVTGWVLNKSKDSFCSSSTPLAERTEGHGTLGRVTGPVSDKVMSSDEDTWHE